MCSLPADEYGIVSESNWQVVIVGLRPLKRFFTLPVAAGVMINGQKNERQRQQRQTCDQGRPPRRSRNPGQSLNQANNQENEVAGEDGNEGIERDQVFFAVAVVECQIKGNVNQRWKQQCVFERFRLRAEAATLDLCPQPLTGVDQQA